jgi:hypothetical protein
MPIQSPERNGHADDTEESRRTNGNGQFYYHDDDDDLAVSKSSLDSKYSAYGLGSKSYETEPKKFSFDLDSSSLDLQPTRRPYRFLKVLSTFPGIGSGKRHSAN